MHGSVLEQFIDYLLNEAKGFKNSIPIINNEIVKYSLRKTLLAYENDKEIIIIRMEMRYFFVIPINNFCDK